MKNQILKTLLLALTGISFLGCGRIGITNQKTPASLYAHSNELEIIELSPPEATLKKGEWRNVTAIGHFRDGSAIEITPYIEWNSSDDKVIRIESFSETAGKVSGLTEGEVRLTARFGRIESSIPVKVRPDQDMWATNQKVKPPAEAKTLTQ